MKNGKSCGFDCILNEMIKYGQHELLPCIVKLFNHILIFSANLDYGLKVYWYQYLNFQIVWIGTITEVLLLQVVRQAF